MVLCQNLKTLSSWYHVSSFGTDGIQIMGGSKTSEEKGKCASCGNAAETRCTGCRNVFYCGRECQKKGWSQHKDSCRPFAVSKRKDVGRFLVASRDLTVDDVILCEAPLVMGPKQMTEPVCLGCYKHITSKYRCPRCSWPTCGPECDAQAAHAPECQVTSAAGVDLDAEMASAETPVHLYEVVTVLRCLVIASRDSKKWRASTERLNTRYLKAVGSPQYHHNQEYVVNALRDKFLLHQHPGVDASDAAIHTALGLLQINNIPTKTRYGEVQAIYPMSSLLSHSCIPNTKMQWENGRLTVRASDPIKRGDPITAIFTDILWGTRARQDHIQQTRLLTCTCKRCQDPTELNTFFSALKCRRCGGTVLPEKPLDDASPWLCRECSHQMTTEEVLGTNLALGAAVEVALTKPSITSLEALQKEWVQRVHPNHYHLHAVKHSLLQLYGRSKEKANEEEKDEAHWIEIDKKEKVCKEFLTVCSRLDPSTQHTVPFVGLTFYEYHKTILQNAQRHFSQAKLTTQQLKKRMLLSKALLRKALDIFKNEPEDTPEGQLCITCEEEIIRIGKWMLAVGLV
ncbi:SET domain-containing protein SmydA-8-like [Penaeus monodon]|uniref:SET domain-containing protein SmydA-8-like n=1 Tax=Penaeus monodon TaxID=6687 RepID=UPI0018A7865F|nr:SET domain-containing protein SmydA-8-like [Penaeus monodon]XP_037800022.1 SET domain-containing protein SmydA-8-like [Penaeus monodon]